MEEFDPEYSHHSFFDFQKSFSPLDYFNLAFDHQKIASLIYIVLSQFLLNVG